MKMAKAKTEENSKLFVKGDAAWDKGDLRRAFESFLQAAEAGDASSQISVGYFFDCGLHVKQDKKRALHWYHQAYRQGEACAANNIATVHRDCGNLSRMNWWLRRAIALGDGEALFELGKNYEAGFGVRKNSRRAEEFYRRVVASKAVSVDCREKASRRLARLERKDTLPAVRPGGRAACAPPSRARLEFLP